MKRILITGIAGQDGSYLAENLLKNNYEVHGIVRRNSVPEHQESRVDHIAHDIKTYYGDVTDPISTLRIIEKVQPWGIINLAAQSHVRISYDIPKFTAEVNSIGALNLLEILRTDFPEIRYYQASSSEMFGDSVDEDGFQRETTAMHPVSPYGIAKLFSFHASRNYRKAFKLFASNGILFNHESPRRGSNFVTTKIIKRAVEIKKGFANDLILGNLDSHRDWGHSADYVEAIRLILEHSEPDDFVVATGVTNSVRNLLEFTFGALDLNYLDYVKQDEKFMRPEELPYLKGDPTKIREKLNWTPKYTFEDLIQEMIKSWWDRIN